MQQTLSQRLRWLALLSATLLFSAAHAEQKLTFDGYELHYVVIPTSFLSADIAKDYALVRGKGRALVNLSLLKEGVGVRATALSGQVKNLLSQEQILTFEEVTEGDAIYYLAQLRHSDRDTLVFTVEITAPDLPAKTLRFTQKLYADGTTVPDAD